jgi:hypothetical protein
MQEDERNLLESLQFELFEETVGSWLRSIMQCLERSREPFAGSRIRNQDLQDGVRAANS